MLDESIKKQIQSYKNTEKDRFFLDDLSKAEQTQNEQDLFERFYTDLEFGTGGIRGIIGAGTNRLNTLVVQRIGEGWANYLVSQFPTIQPKVVIAYDSRRFSDVFAKVVSEVLTAHAIKVYCFPSLRPTPQLSFTIRNLQAQSGMVITASHNPPNYNGLKIYWSDGGQVIYPQDEGIMAQIEQAKSLTSFNLLDIEDAKSQKLYQELSQEEDMLFQNYVASVLLQPEIFDIEDDFKIVYTPLHGTGTYHIEQLMQDYAIKGTIEPSQKEPNGEFPTVKFPNPEDPLALINAIKTAKQIGAQLVIANDPDADRVGLAEKIEDDFVCLTGNQTGVLLLDYILQLKKASNTLQKNSIFINTIVTTFLQEHIAKSYGLEVIKTYTGFKNIAEPMAQIEKEGKSFVFSCEESYGYLASMEVRDKDGISIALLCIEMAKYYFSKGKTLSHRLEELYLQYGYYQEETVNKILEGSDGKEKIAKIMKTLRDNTPHMIGKEKVVRIEDYSTRVVKNMRGEIVDTLNFSKTSNVLIFTTETNNVLCIRPSGTEPKIKFYFLYHCSLDNSIQESAQSHTSQLSRLDIAKKIVQENIVYAKETLERWLV